MVLSHWLQLFQRRLWLSRIRRSPRTEVRNRRRKAEHTDVAAFFEGMEERVMLTDVVSMAVIDANASELSGDTGTFRVSRSGSVGTLTVDYSVSGTSTADSDYTALSGSVSFANGETWKDIIVSPVNDTLAESSETVTITVSAAGAGQYTLGSPTTGTVSIADDDSGSGLIQFSVTGGGNVTEDATDGDGNNVPFTIGYSGSLTGNQTASVDVSHVLDQTNSADYSTNVAAAITAAVASTPGTTFNGTTLTFGPVAASTTSMSQYAGTAADGGGGAAWSNLATAAGNNTADYASVPLDWKDYSNQLRLTNFGFNIPSNATINGITVTLNTTGSDTSRDAPGVSLTKSGTVIVGTAPASSSNWDSGSVVVGSSSSLWSTTWTPAEINSSTFGTIVKVRSDDDGYQFRVRTAQILVSYSIPGSAAPTSLNFTAHIADDSIGEDTEDFSVALSNATTTSSPGATITTSSATATIVDNDGPAVPVISITAQTPTVLESETNTANYGRFRVSRSDAADPLTVQYSVDETSTASASVDYTALTGSVTFAIGESFQDILVAPINDSVSELSETLKVNLLTATAGQYALSPTTSENTATVTIIDPARFSISGSSFVTEDPTDADDNKATYTITRSGTLNAGESASIDLSVAAGQTSSGDFTTNVASAIAAATASTPGVSWNGTTLTFAPTGTGSGNASSYGGTATAGSDWVNPSLATGNTPSNGATSFVWDSDWSSDIYLTNFGFSIPENATITGIATTLNTTGSGDSRSSNVRLTKNGVANAGTSQGAGNNWNTGTVLSGGSTNLWGTTWTPAEINAATFGTIVRVRADDDADFYVRSVNLLVSYTVPGVAAPTSLTFSAEITNDGIAEADEGFSLSISNPTTTNANGAATGLNSSVTTTIVSDGTSLPVSSLNGTTGFTINGVALNDLAGTSVSGAGDVNHDGYDDLIIGAPGAASNRGAAYVVFGVPGGFGAITELSSLNGENGFVVRGIASGNRTGFAVGGGRDINGDGFADIIIGAPGSTVGSDLEAGRTYVLFGTSTFPSTIDLATLNGTNGFALSGIDPGDEAGRSVSMAGDFNGDGYDDVIVGAGLTAGDTDAGEAYVVFGKSTGFTADTDLSSLNGTNGFRLKGIAANDALGVSVSGAGDINADGYDDLIVGALNAGATDSGDAYVVFGSGGNTGAILNVSTLNGTNGFRIAGIHTGDSTGVSVSGAGDFNGDGFDDLIIGAKDAENGSTVNVGNAYVVFGKSGSFSGTLDLSLLDGSDGFRFEGINDSDAAGFSVASAGDFNADGYDDILVGAPGSDPYGVIDAGEVYLVFGAASGFSATFSLASIDGVNGVRLRGINTGDAAGTSTSAVGDVNGDGFDDVIIGASDADPSGRSFAGQSYVIFGHNDSPGAGTQIGTAAANTLIAAQGTGARDVLIGGRGSDILVSDGGADILRGGQGDDVLSIADASFSGRRLRGGSGTDTLRLDAAGVTLDLTAIPNNRLADIEQIDVRGTGNNALTLNQLEVLNLSSSSNTLLVRADSGDTINIGAGWSQQIAEIHFGEIFRVFAQGAATLLVEAAATIPELTNVPVGDVSPQQIDLFLNPEETSVQNVSLTFDSQTGLMADIVFVVDESGSMAGEQAWIGSMISGLDASLAAAGITDARYALIGFEATGRQFAMTTSPLSYWGNATEFATASQALVTTRGGTEDGYDGIAMALDNLTYRSGASRHVILVTDENRDVTPPNLTYSSVLNSLGAKNATLHAIINGAIDTTNQTTNALGIDGSASGATAYFANGSGGYTSPTSGGVAFSFDSSSAGTDNDYINLAFDVGGTVWDLNKLRAGGNTAVSFSQAFVSRLTDQISAEQVNLVASDPAVSLEILGTSFSATGISYDVRLTGTASPQAFDLQFVRDVNGTNTILGSIPVTITPYQVRMTENSDFHTDHTQTFSIPAGTQSLHVNIFDLNFDRLDTNDMRDAFELALVDANGTSLVSTLGVGRDAFFSMTEGLTPISAGGVLYEAGAGAGFAVTLDLSQVLANTQVTLIARLINNDDDTKSTVSVQPNATLLTTSVVADPVLSTAIEQRSPSGPVNFAFLSDVTRAIDISYGRTTFAERDGRLRGEMTLTNSANYPLFGQMIAVIRNISAPNVQVFHPDGFTPEGFPYYDLTNLAIAGEQSTWQPGVSFDSAGLTFLNPNKVHFDYELQFLAHINERPHFTSTPRREVVGGVVYADNAIAVDPESGLLTYTMIGGPAGLTIDSATGQLLWTTATSDVGRHEVTLRVSDPYGLFDEQTFVISVVTGVPNRTPYFTSVPIVDAFVGQVYASDTDAVDPDGDVLVYSLVSVSVAGQPEFSVTGLSIDSATGLVNWTPPANLVGATVMIVIQADDGEGATAEQGYQIVVHADPINSAPIIVSHPVTNHIVPEFPTPANGNVSPTAISLALGPGESVTRTVSITTDGSTVVQGQPVGPANAMTVFGETGAQALLSALMAGSNAGIVVTSINVSGQDTRNNSTGFQGVSTGVFVNNNNTYGLNQYGIVISTGDARDYGSGPNSSTYNSGAYGAIPTTQELALLQPISGFQGSHRDATMINITFDLLPGYDTIEFDVVFGSEEYPEWQQTTYLDPFGMFVNGQNVAFVDGYPININHPAMKSHPDGAAALGQTPNPLLGGTELDGVLAPNGNPIVRYSAYVGSGTSGNTLTFIIADSGVQGDSVIDSTAYISGIGATGDAGPIDIDVEPSEAGKPFVNNTGVVTITPVDTATFNVTFTGDGHSDAYDLLFVNDETGTILGSIPVTMNSSYFYLVQAVDPDGDPLVYDLTTAPIGADIDPQTGRITWDAPAPGDYEFTVRVSDGRGGFDEQNFVVTVVDSSGGNTAPVMTDLPDLTIQVGHEIAVPVQATDSDGDFLQYYLTAAPAGMVINRDTGLITWLPVPGQEDATYGVTVKALDRRGGEATDDFEITVSSGLFINSQPEITSTPAFAAVADSQYRYSVTASDPDNDILTFGLALAPYGAGIDPNTGQVVWIPRAYQAGPNTFAVQVTDPNGGIDVQTFVVYVAFENAPPEIVSTTDGYAGVGTLWTYDVDAIDPNGDLLKYSLDPISVGRGLTINADTGLIQFTPAALGLFEVTVFVTDYRGGTANQTFLLDAGENALPHITSLPGIYAVVGQEYTYAISATDPDPGDTIAFYLELGYRGMTIGTDDVLRWIPRTPGIFPVEVQAVDSYGNSETQIYTLYVRTSDLSNNAPYLTSKAAGPAARNLPWEYRASAVDLDGDALTWTLDTSGIPAEAIGNLSIDPASGRVTWTPTIPGSFTMTVTVTDPSGAFASERFTLPVLSNAPPHITSTEVITAVLGQPYTYDVNAIDPNTEDNAGLTYVLHETTISAGLVIDSQTGVITWTPLAGHYVVPVIVTVIDPHGAFDYQSFDLVILNPGPNQPPVIESDLRSRIAVGQRLLHQVIATDPNNDPLTFTLVDAPVGMKMTASGLIDWTPADYQTGNSYTFSVDVTDGRVSVPVRKSFTIEVVSQMVNGPPVFITAAKTSLIVGVPYQYDARAVDPDGDTLVYHLVSGPAGMTIDSRTGVVRWTPGIANFGDQILTISATDTLGMSAVQTTTLTIRGTNRPPQIAAQPPATAVVNQPYLFDFDATDPDGHSVTYSLGSATNASGTIGIDLESGLLTWTPDVLGPQSIQVNIVDELGMGITFLFRVEVLNAPPNSPPQITSVPARVAAAGFLFEYDVNATDPDVGTTITYTLVQPASLLSGMTFSTSTGLLQWTPDSSLIGTLVQFQVQASDGQDTATQWFSISVRPPNVAPSITPVNDLTITAGAPFVIGIQATDANGDPLSYSLDPASLALGLTISDYGRIAWNPTTAHVTGSPYTVTVTVSDGQASVTESFDLTVIPDTLLPSVAISLDRSVADVGGVVYIFVQATDNIGVLTKTLTLAGVTQGGNTIVINQGIAIDAHGRGVLTLLASHIGTLTFTATAVDAAGNVGTAIPVTLLVADPTDVSAPTAQIDSPFDNQRVTAPIDIYGTVADADGILLWTLTARSFDGGSTKTIATGTAPIVNGILGRFDPTILRNGSYLLELNVTDIGGHKAYDSVTVEVDGGLKLGNFAVSFTDLSVTVGSLAIVVSRSYDSLDADLQGEFGYGWKLDLSNTKVEVKYPGGASLSSFEGNLPPFKDGTRVIVTLPGGKREGFTFYGTPGTQYFGTVFDWIPKFYPDAGVTSKLITDQVRLLKTGNGEYVDTESNHAYNPADSAFGGSYVLQLRNGVELAINAETGDLASITDLVGNQLQFTGDGIHSSNALNALLPGRKVDFEYDYAGRISAVVDPAGKRIEYTYNSAGDLVGVTDRVGATTTFEYRTDVPHYLENILDSQGVAAARTQYGADGRVSTVTDAAGKTIEYTYNGNTLIQTVTDQLGYVTTITLNGNGDAVREVRPDGGITKRAFDNEHRLLSETLVIGLEDSALNGETNDLTTTNVYDTTGNLLSTTDSRGMMSQSTYNEYGQPTTTTDAFGNTSIITYDTRGLPSQMRDAYGNRTLLTYDERGNLTVVRNDAGTVLVTNTYNDFNDLLSSTTLGGQTTTHTYDIEGRRTSTTTSGTLPTGGTVLWIDRTTYDDNGRVIGTQRVKSIGGVETVLTSSASVWNGNGQQTSSTDTHGLITENTYDIRGLLIQTRRQVADSDGQLRWFVSRTVYDAAGRAVASTESYPEGSTEPIRGNRMTYDVVGRVTLSEQLYGVNIELTQSGGVASTTLVDAGTVQSSSLTEYDNSGRVTRSVDAYNNETLTTYDSQGNVTQTRSQTRDENGTVLWRVSRTVYDSFGRAVVTADLYLDATGTATSSGPVYASRTLFDARGSQIASQRLSGAIIVLVPATGVTTLQTPGTVLFESHSVYDSKGRLSESFGPTGLSTKNEYDALGRQIASLGPAVSPASVGLTAPAGATSVRLRSETVYDERGRTWKQRTNIRQYDNGVIDASAVQETVFTYDYRSNLVQTTYTDGSTMKTAYDDLGRKTSETNAMNLTRTFGYNTYGQLTSVTLPSVGNPLNSGQLAAPQYQYSYNDQGQMTELTDPLGRDTRFTFSEQGQQLSRTLPLGFGADGMFGTADDPAPGSGGNLPFTETMQYDTRGRMKLQTSFEGVVTEYVYDDSDHGNGRVSERRFYRTMEDYTNGLVSESQTMTYDAFGRQVSMVWQRDVTQTTGAPVDTWTNQYDVQGRLTRVTSPTGEIQYEYDIFGRQTRVASRSAGFQPVDAADFENDMRYSYDTRGRLSKVETLERNNVPVDVDPVTAGNQAETETYAYTLQGNLDYEINPDGSTTDYSYDDLNRLTSLVEYRPDAITPNVFTDNPKLSEYHYTLRADGKKESADEQIFNDNGTLYSHTTFDWTYDDAGRLTDEVFTDVGDLLANVDDYLAHYTYDLTGNRLEKSVISDTNHDGIFNAATDKDEVTSYTNDANDRMLSESTVVDGTATESTAYGFTGTQQTSKVVTPAGSGSPLSAVSFIYDLQGRMYQATTETFNTGTLASRTRATYQYGTDGIRFSARSETDTVLNPTTANWQLTTDTKYLIDANNHTGYQQVLEETVTDGNGDVVKKIVYTIGHDHISQTTFAPGGDAQGQTAVFHMDGHGSTRVLTDLAGSIVQLLGVAQVFHYDAYGNALNFNITAAATQYLYSGEQFDSRIGQQYLRGRYYDSATGTFNRLDPFFGNRNDPQSFHKYLYTHADPVYGVDPTGKFAISIALGIGGFLAGVAIGYGVQSRYNAAVTAQGAATISKLLSWAYTARFGIPLLTGAGGYLGAAAAVTAANPLKVIWTGPGTPTTPTRDQNVRLSDWIDNVANAMAAHLDARTDITDAQRTEGKAVAQDIAEQYVRSVQTHAIKVFDIQAADGVFFGKNGNTPGWIGNFLDKDGERDCDNWATHVRNSVSGNNGWKVQRVEDALKAGDLALGLLFKHNFVLLTFDPNGSNPAPAFVLDPWINARPEIWDYDTFNGLWPVESASKIY